MTQHTFHIPVMGIAFTIDTPVKVAHYGISSVISLVDDVLIEKMRKYHSGIQDVPYTAIGSDEDDCRAKRITAYLNLVGQIVAEKFKNLADSPFEEGSEITKYLEMLPEDSKLRHVYNEMLQANNTESIQQKQSWLRENLEVGSIDVNIMTKLDKTNYNTEGELSIDHNDAHAALRGFALSDLSSSALVLSAGFSPRLYGYMASFDDFYPDEKSYLKKKIILKVSDYRSALTQGKFLAKKGLWVSEYRIESGLNCGGHAFATDGYLLGPILEQFRNDKEALIDRTHALLIAALKNKNKPWQDDPLDLKITVQGGIGTAEEQRFLTEYYKADSTGWGSPFLLVPEAATVDKATLNSLCEAKEDDLYLSEISPIGVLFNSLRGNTKDKEKQLNIEKGRPGSPCIRKKLLTNKEFTERPICTASREYQNLKIAELKEKKLDPATYKTLFNKIVEKSCICVGLGTPALLANDLDSKVEGPGVSVCPGPNIAYFTKIVTLKEMVDHIYGRLSILNVEFRPNMFIKELDMYIEYFKNLTENTLEPLKEKQIAYLDAFHGNLQTGIAYYKNLFHNIMQESKSVRENLLDQLENMENKLSCINLPV